MLLLECCVQIRLIKYICIISQTIAESRLHNCIIGKLHNCFVFGPEYNEHTVNDTWSQVGSFMQSTICCGRFYSA